MTASFVLGVLSVGCALGAAWRYFKERRARRWPIVAAQVVETTPQSLLERTGRMSVWNRDSDHFLEWSVNGQIYRVKLEDDASVALSGFKLWRRAPATNARALHYNPANPLKHVLAEHFGAWKVLVGIAVVACTGALIAGSI